MPAIIEMGYTFAVDGVTRNGFFVTPTDGTTFTFNVVNSPGAIPAVIETAVQTLAAVQLPQFQIFCHCYSVIPFNIVLWVGDPGSTPANAVWWN